MFDRDITIHSSNDSAASLYIVLARKVTAKFLIFLRSNNLLFKLKSTFVTDAKINRSTVRLRVIRRNSNLKRNILYLLALCKKADCRRHKTHIVFSFHTYNGIVKFAYAAERIDIYYIVKCSTLIRPRTELSHPYL
jgi:hypothetical protein